MDKKTIEISNLRQEYSLNKLQEQYVFDDPIKQFDSWFKEAVAGEIHEPNAMILSTVNSGQPRSRTVLLKGFDEKGFVFYTNYESDKGREIGLNNAVSLLFYWDRLERQVRIGGKAERLPASVSDEYFSLRPRGSQIGAWVSNQSEVIPDKSVLEQRQARLQAEFGEELPIPRPDHWGGYLVIPHQIEFWQGRPSRLHDRLVYELENDKKWKISRLSP